jgi:hypothetical protein
MAIQYYKLPLLTIGAYAISSITVGVNSTTNFIVSFFVRNAEQTLIAGAGFNKNDTSGSPIQGSLAVTLDNTPSSGADLDELNKLKDAINKNNADEPTIDISTAGGDVTIVVDGNSITGTVQMGTSPVSLGVTNNPPCFGVDTEVLCLNNNFEEVYIPIKDIRKGTLVKSYKHGYRKVLKIGKSKIPFVNDPNNWRKCMYVCKKTDNMTGDLTLTGGHSILVDHKTEQQIELSKQMWGNGKIDDKYLLQTPLCDNFTPILNGNIYDFYSLILENNNNVNERFGIWVNGVLVETSSEQKFLSYENKLDLIN